MKKVKLTGTTKIGIITSTREKSEEQKFDRNGKLIDYDSFPLNKAGKARIKKTGVSPADYYIKRCFFPLGKRRVGYKTIFSLNLFGRRFRLQKRIIIYTSYLKSLGTPKDAVLMVTYQSKSKDKENKK